VELVWTDNSTNEDGFIIEKETLTEAFVVIDTVLANSNSYQDLDVAIQTYNYRIKAFILRVHQITVQWHRFQFPLS